MSAQKPEAVLKILEKLDGIKQWREEQFQIFQEKQVQKVGEKATMPGLKDSEYYLIQNKENFNIGESPNNQPIESSFTSNLTADSSVTSHILRCFNDSTERSAIVSKGFTQISIKQPGHEVLKPNDEKPGSDVPSKKPVRPFLRKRTGLSRFYKPKPSKDTTPDHNEQKETHSAQDKHSTKSIQDFVSSQRNHFQSNEQKYATSNEDANSKIDTYEQFENLHRNLNSKSNSAFNKSNQIQYKTTVDTVSSDQSSSEPTHQLCGSVYKQTLIPLESVSATAEDDMPNIEFSPAKDNSPAKLNRSADLEEFERIEQFVENTSFTSDSSVIQRIVQGDCIIPNKQVPDNAGLKQQYAAKRYSFDSPFSNLNFSKVRSEALARRKQLESNFAVNSQPISSTLQENHTESRDVNRKHMANNNTQEKKIETIDAIMSDNERRIDTLQKEIASKNEVFVEDSIFDKERCSTPLNVDTELNNPFSSDLDKEKMPQYMPLVSNTLNENQEEINPKTKDASEDLLRDSSHLIENEDASCPSNPEEKEIKEKMKQKIALLQKEIETYQELNVHLEKISKERDEMSRKLKKEYDDIEKYKTEQKKRIEEEVKKERQQIKRERDNFEQLKNYQKENFTRKEREELSALRKENEKLQEELKRERNKCKRDTQRMKSQLIAAEKEREESKLKVISLEEHVEDLLNALRTMQTKIRLSARSSESISSQNVEDILKSSDDSLTTVDSKNNNNKKDSTKRKMPIGKTPHSNKSVKVNVSKPRVRFNLTPQYETHKNDLTSPSLKNSKKDHTINEHDISSSNENETSADNVTEDEENNSAKPNISNLTLNDENIVEKLLPSGEREIIYPSGTKKTIKIDGTIYIEFSNGDTKYILPDKREIHYFENGIIERSYPDGSKVTEFPNGQVQYLMPDGIRQIKFPDGDCLVAHPDGYEIFEGVDGMKTIRKPDGTSILYGENGEKEIRTSTFKKREYPDGSVKFIYNNGRRETRYSNGRIKIKDKDGKIIMDTKYMTRKKT